MGSGRILIAKEEKYFQGKWWFYASVIILNRDPNIGRSSQVRCWAVLVGEKPFFCSIHCFCGQHRSTWGCRDSICVVVSRERCWFVFESFQPSLRVFFLNTGVWIETDSADTRRLNCAAQKRDSITRARTLLEWMSVSSPPMSSSSIATSSPHSLSFALPLFLPPSAFSVSLSHLSFDMEISHQPQPEASWLFLKMYLLKAAQFLIKCSHCVYKRQTLSLGK